jgi:hypothetical protein
MTARFEASARKTLVLRFGTPFLDRKIRLRWSLWFGRSACSTRIPKFCEEPFSFLAIIENTSAECADK